MKRLLTYLSVLIIMMIPIGSKALPTNTADGLYLIGNFFNTDGSSINTTNRIFKFEPQTNGTYKLDFPATITANVRLVNVVNGTATEYAPSSDPWITAGTVSSNGSKTQSLTTTSSHYWQLYTRNDNGSNHEDDGIYEISVTFSEGVPISCTFKHNPLRRVAYFISTEPGATAQPVYDSRNNDASDFSNKTWGRIRFNSSYGIYVIGNVVHDNESATINLSSSTYGTHVNLKNNSIRPTTNKLFFEGNGGRIFQDSNPFNEVSPNEDDIRPTNKTTGLYTVEYNPSNGNTEDARNTGHLGIRGQIILKSGGADDPITSVSMVGPAIAGTTSGDTWIWDSTVGDMTWDATERCYKLTLNTSSVELGKHFRFVINHTQAKNLYETGNTARIPYTDTQGNQPGTVSCTDTEPNDVAYTTSGTSSYTSSDYDILFNRPAGTWTVRLYMVTHTINNNITRSYYYTITGTESPAPTTLDFTPKGGLFINSAKITVTGGTAPYTYTVNDGSGNVRSTGNFVLAANDDEDNYRISTPGYLTVTDANGNTATSNELFDFTYSTSENYKNYNNNATISKTVQTGGGAGALNVFMQVDETLDNLWLYAYNKTLDSKLKDDGEKDQDKIDRQVRLTSAFPGDNIKDADQINIDGIKYVHFTIPEDNLREGDKVAIIVSQGSTKQQYWYTQTTDAGIEIERTSDPAFIYVVKNSPNAAPSTGSENSKGTNYLLRMSEDGNRTIFVTVPEGWNDGTIYCDGWKDGGGEQEKLAWQSSAEWLQLYDASTRTYIYQVPDGITNFYIATTNSIGTQTQTKRSVAVSYSGGRKMYTIQSSKDGSGYYNMTETSEGVPAADLDELTTFLNTPPTTTVITNKYPNGEDYWRAAPGDLSIKLDPTWGGKTLENEATTRDWAGNMTKRVNATQMPLTQTIQGLNAGKTYTVQAIVRGEGENNKTVTLTLEGAETVTKTLNLRDGSGNSKNSADLSRQGSEITMTGRVEYIEPQKFEGMNKYTGTDAGGWAKVEATVKASQAGWLTISLTGDEWFNLSQVTLLEDANTDHGFRTTASTSATDTDLANVDFRDRSWKKNNAYSFFDRGKNRNAVVFANDRTVIAMNPDHLADDLQNTELKAVDRRHPFNVVGIDEDDSNVGTAKALYLTDMGYGGNTTDYPGDADNPVDYDQTDNITGYSRSGYTFIPKFALKAEDVVFDRILGGESYKKQTTILLPFEITVTELKKYYGTDLKVWKYNGYNLAKKTILFTEVTGTTEANVPYILTEANGKLDSRNLTSEERNVKEVAAIQNAEQHTATSDGGFTGSYIYQDIPRTASINGTTLTHFAFNPTTGKFQVIHKNGAAMKPFRAYFSVPVVIEENNNAPAFTVIFDDTTTGISESVQVDVEPTNVYTLGGILVARNGDLSRLPKGVYIVNGKKVIK